MGELYRVRYNDHANLRLSEEVGWHEQNEGEQRIRIESSFCALMNASLSFPGS